MLSFPVRTNFIILLWNISIFTGKSGVCAGTSFRRKNRSGFRLFFFCNQNPNTPLDYFRKKLIYCLGIRAISSVVRAEDS